MSYPGGEPFLWTQDVPRECWERWGSDHHGPRAECRNWEGSWEAGLLGKDWGKSELACHLKASPNKHSTIGFPVLEPRVGGKLTRGAPLCPRIANTVLSALEPPQEKIYLSMIFCGSVPIVIVYYYYYFSYCCRCCYLLLSFRFVSTGESQQQLLPDCPLLHQTLPLSVLGTAEGLSGTPCCLNIYLLLTKGAGFLNE